MKVERVKYDHESKANQSEAICAGESVNYRLAFSSIGASNFNILVPIIV